jgi:hypothetical protein
MLPANELIEDLWHQYLATHPDARTPEAAEDLERKLLGGATFDLDDAYLVDMAARILAEAGQGPLAALGAAD